MLHPLHALQQMLLPLTGAPAAAPAGAGASPGIVGPPGSNPVLVRILAINDFHGQLGDSDAKIGADAVGGAATLAGYIDRERAANPNGTVLVSAGDATGASPPESTLLDHKSTFATLAAMGVDVATPGNHEWDRGYDESMRMMFGGRKKKAVKVKVHRRVHGKVVTKTVTRMVATGPRWPGSPFPFVSCNIVDIHTHKPIMKPYIIKEVNGVKVAFIGAVTKDLKNVTLASGIPNIEALDPATAINSYVPQLKAQGVHTIVVLLHEGGDTDPKTGQVQGPVVDIANRLDPDVDVIASAHSHKEYVTRIAGKLVTQAMSYAKAFAEIDLAVDPKTDDVVASNARVIKNLEKDAPKDPTVDHMVQAFMRKVAPVANRVLSILPGPVTRVGSPAGETAMGTLIAEAQRRFADTDIAFMNPGGIRQDLTEGGPVTWGKVFGVQPFANQVVRSEMTGADILAVLEQMFPPPAPGSHPTILQVAGMRVWYDVSKPIGHRITKVMMDDGSQLSPRKVYTVAANSFLMGGGDGFTNFSRAKKKKVVGVDLDALVKYLEDGNPVPTHPIGRMHIAGGSLPEDAH